MLYFIRRRRPANWCCGLFLLFLSLPVTNGFTQQPELSSPARALFRGDYEHAKELAVSLLQKKPNDLPVRIILARAELAMGNYGGALAQLKRILALDPHNIDALYYLSFAARGMSQQEYERLFRLNPESARVHQLLAEAALEAQDRSLAETEFRNALQINPHSVEVATALGELKRSQSKFDEAITYYSKAAEIGSVDYEIAYGLGACYTYKQDYPRAIEWLRRSVTMSPDSGAAHFALGNALFQSGDWNAAVPELAASLRLEPRMKQAYFLLGRAYAKLGRKQEADAAFQKLDQLNGPATSVQNPAASKDVNKETPREP
jgi:tetratricopeptide (TPR) repeat protein